jgi:hypothetical protein
MGGGSLGPALARALLCGALVVAGAASPAQAAAGRAAAPPTLELRDGGMLWLRPNPDAIRALGARNLGADGPGRPWTLPLVARDSFRVELADGAPTRFLAGELEVPALRFTRRGGARTPALRIRPDPGQPLGLRLEDSRGALWLRITHAMRSPDVVNDGVRLVTADLRFGPALAAWGEVPALEGTLLGNVTLHLPLDPATASLQAAARAKSAKSCPAPNWPGTPGFRTDVQLVDMVDVFGGPGVNVLRCRTGGLSGCDGPGGFDGEVVFVPSARLKNHTGEDAADVPWYQQFTGPRPPYGNDQHPYLVWNMYRIDAEGRLEQIGRSGLKHAFATANEFCSAEAMCPYYGPILGRSCEDIYNAGSNDLNGFLAPRREVVAARGVWGRCGSAFDPDCDGDHDSPLGETSYRERMVLRESDIEASSNPGATYLIDAWYVVRGDEDIFNTMGYRSLVPTFSAGFWNPGTLGAFRQGSVLDTWLESAPTPWRRGRSVLSTGEGQVGIATRVSRLPGGQYRYDYAIANHDFARAVIDPATSEPNLRVLRNLGLGAIELELVNGAQVLGHEYRDGDDTAGNDWPAATVTGGWRWTAPLDASLDWGSQVFLRVVSDSPPGAGRLRLSVAEAGSPAFYDAAVLAPDAGQVFYDSFE